MIIRVIAKNIFSFKETTEFNTLTSSKIRELPHHKLKKGKYNVLKFSALAFAAVLATGCSSVATETVHFFRSTYEIKFIVIH